MRTIRRTTRGRLAAGTLAAVAAVALAGCGTETAGAGGDGGGGGGAAANDSGGGSSGSDGATGGGGGDGDGGSSDEETVASVRWVPQTITVDGEETPRPAWADRAFLTIEPGRAEGGGGNSGGHTGCNYHGADVTVDGDRLRVSDHVSTMMACPGRPADFERNLLDVFLSDPTFEVSEDGRTLTLTNTDTGDSMTLQRDDSAAREVVGARWVAQSVTANGEEKRWPAEVDDGHVTIAEDGTMEGGSGCNSFNGEVRVEGTRFHDVEFMVTEMGCPDPAMEFEGHFQAVLASEPTFELSEDGRTLTLTDIETGENMVLTRDEAEPAT
ncbi:META domain-containing protein [Streptomyces sp. 4N509B]|uniref:META domain-containing protein n=1 Tax=Streptomyces sp. 4N509B TaxID=3457413 RepID=UPI003FD13E37